MVRHRGHRAALAVLLAGCVILPSSTVRHDGPARVDQETERQLTVAARTMLEHRTEALVQRVRARSLPSEVLGVRIAPQVVRAQQEALRRLETRNRAPVPGGPPFTDAETRLTDASVVRRGDRITLDATEYTKIHYLTPQGRRAVTQRVRRRFEFTVGPDRITLVGERLIDPDATPINDPDRPMPVVSSHSTHSTISVESTGPATPAADPTDRAVPAAGPTAGPTPSAAEPNR
ncbi:hypothetical protein [Thermomonospora catenispora]|uniref:hypothetical protein n=1 Tax=Thermomonospora catenispora TaxID=2493090 RepID=UPI00158EAB18|nr:hypothetical protein [Thermomonospora catenispora]